MSSLGFEHTCSWSKRACYHVDNASTELDDMSDALILVSSKVMKINGFEFAKWSFQYPNHIEKYNILKDEWQKWIKFPEGTNAINPFCNIKYDSEQNKMYFVGMGEIVILNVDGKNDYKTYSNDGSGVLAPGIIVNHKCHFIGGIVQINNINYKHFIWNEQTNQFDTLHQFEFPSQAYYRIVHLKSKNALLLFAGDTMHLFHIKSDIYTSKWTQLKQKIPHSFVQRYFGCILSRNDEYIVMMGGQDETDEQTDQIFVLHTDSMIFKQSRINCPKKGVFQAINMNCIENEDLLCFGYIQSVWKLNEFKDVKKLPCYLIQTISNFFSFEMVYLLDYEYELEHGNHWKINIDHIISNLV
eukprot:454526_1